MIMSLKQKKINFEPRIKLNHNIYITDSYSIDTNIKTYNLRATDKYTTIYNAQTSVHKARLTLYMYERVLLGSKKVSVVYTDWCPY